LIEAVVENNISQYLVRGLLSITALAITLLAVSAAFATDRINEPLRPLYSIGGLDSRKVALGDRLFHDPRLSTDNTISCASCHVLKTDGADSLPSAIGVAGAKGPIKTPTVYNSVFNFAQFWDGRAETLEEQAVGPIHNPLEMSSSWKEVIPKLAQDPEMVGAFQKVYEDGITPENIVDSIATFERTLITVDAPFDRWLKGDDGALGEMELKGYELFKSYGCSSCHQGRNAGGNLYAFMGAMGDYFADQGREITVADLGRFNVTGNEEDKHFFKVPSLRLAARQRYYFHDASSDSLEEAIQIMGRYQLGRMIPDADAAAIAVFLESLVGSHPRLEP
jgi:cytochrome c peroxidase